MERFFTFVFIAILSVFILTGTALSILVDDPNFVLVEMNENEENNSESESECNLNNSEYPDHDPIHRNVLSIYEGSANLSFIYLINHYNTDYTKIFTPPPQRS